MMSPDPSPFTLHDDHALDRRRSTGLGGVAEEGENQSEDRMLKMESVDGGRVRCYSFFQLLTVFSECFSTILKTGLTLSKHNTRFTQPDTQVAEHLQSFAK